MPPPSSFVREGDVLVDDEEALCVEKENSVATSSSSSQLVSDQRELNLSLNVLRFVASTGQCFVGFCWFNLLLHRSPQHFKTKCNFVGHVLVCACTNLPFRRTCVLVISKNLRFFEAHNFCDVFSLHGFWAHCLVLDAHNLDFGCDMVFHAHNLVLEAHDKDLRS